MGMSLLLWPACFVAFAVAHSGRDLLQAGMLEVRFQEEARRLVGDDSSGGIVVWVGVTMAAMLAKLTSSTDDVVWLLPFMATEQRRRNVLVYICCMQSVVLLAWCFSAGGEALLALVVPTDSSWPLSKILELISAILLTCYAIKLFREWYLEQFDPDEEEEDEEADKEEGKQEIGEEEREQQKQPQREESKMNMEPSEGEIDTACVSTDKGDAIIDFGLQVGELGFFVNWTGPQPVVDELKPVSAGGGRGICLGDVLVEINGIVTEGKGRNVLLPMLKSRPVALQVHHTHKGEHPAPAIAEAEVQAEKRCSSGKSPSSPSPALAAVEAKVQAEERYSSPKSPRSPKSPKAKFTSRRLITVSLLGSLDDFAVFTSVLLSGLMSAIQLSIGVLLGSLVVVSICVAAGRLACLVSIVERIPLWVIIGAFSAWTYVSTFALD